jgi:hypothetical protein
MQNDEHVAKTASYGGWRERSWRVPAGAVVAEALLLSLLN